MNRATAAVMETEGKARIALEGVDIQALLRGLLSEVTVTQTYRNLEDCNIEAVYTFPVPRDAVMLELVMDINGRRLKGEVQPRARAETGYEDALDAGDTAVLLEQLEPGLFTINVGNLMPGEAARITYRYGQMHRWQGDSLRFQLPTTIAPRYGEPLSTGMAPHQVPGSALSNGCQLSLVLKIEGALAHADIECPSHEITVTAAEGGSEIRLSGGTSLMDRDFVLLISEPAAAKPAGLWAEDGEGYVALASFHPRASEREQALPQCIKLVVDCSGSMAGDSIAQARKALREILTSFRDEDCFNITAFGSQHRLLFREPMPADEIHLARAFEFLSRIDGNMGGTEIGSALQATYACGCPAGMAADILLITDGEVWDPGSILTEAKDSGHRLFTIGVGTAVAEAFVRDLADRSRGACELVHPSENMAAHIVRHFRRMGQPVAGSISLDWPQAETQQAPAVLETVYAGDTVHVIAWFDEAPDGECRLSMEYGKGQRVTEIVMFNRGHMPDSQIEAVLPRMAAHALLGELESAEAEALAVKYQLLTRQTSCILVSERAAGEKADSVPVLRKVPQVLAAGWGGTGQVQAAVAVRDRHPPVEMSVANHEIDADYHVSRTAMEKRLPHECKVFEMRKIAPLLDKSPVIDALNSRYTETSTAVLDIETFIDLIDLGVSLEIIMRLEELEGERTEEKALVLGLLRAIRLSDMGKGLSRHVKRLIRMAEKSCQIDRKVQDSLRRLLRDWMENRSGGPGDSPN